MTILEVPTWVEMDWSQREAAHVERVRTWVETHRERQFRGETHPVLDFLFSYYAFRPALLERWSPGTGVILAGAGAEIFLSRRHFSRHADGIWLNPEDFPEERRDGLRWTMALLEAVEQRPAQFGCHGLHEWAMVYRAAEVRHEKVALRLAPAELARFVESQDIRCSHHDAFRFFTPEARPLNRLQPERTTQRDLEQSGCLHVNMDLYKWAFKYAPWIAAELVADAFALAAAIREVDMRASPYDLTAHGYQPIPIETEAGRAEYVRCQKDFTRRAAPLRARLSAALRHLESGSRNG